MSINPVVRGNGVLTAEPFFDGLDENNAELELLSNASISANLSAGMHEKYDGVSSYTTIPSMTITAVDDYFELNIESKDVTTLAKYSVLGTLGVTSSNNFGIANGFIWVRDSTGTWHNEAITGIPSATPWDSALTIKVVVESGGWHVYVDDVDGGTLTSMAGQSLVINCVGGAYGTYRTTGSIYSLKIHNSTTETIKALPMNISGAESFGTVIKRVSDYSASDSQTNLQVIAAEDILRIFIKGSDPASNTYIEYSFSRTTIADNTSGSGATIDNLDAWGIKGAYETSKIDDFDYSRTHSNEPIVTTGSWEIAILEASASDFIGSASHGDEILTSTILLVDGQEKSSSVADNYNAKSITFIQNSELFRANTTTKVADRVCRWDITFDGIVVTQSIDWIVSATIDTAYLSMLPIRRTYDDSDTGEQITDTAIVDPDYTIQDVTLIGHSEAATTDATKCNIWGSDSGISAELEVLESPALSGNNIHIASAASYNKVYYSILGTGTSVTSGDSWKVKTRYKINTKN